MTQYTMRKLQSGIIQVAKFEDGKAPTELYHIRGSKCDCFGATRKPFCKHMEMLQKFRAQPDAGVGQIYDQEADTFYKIIDLDDSIVVQDYKGVSIREVYRGHA
jgi:hypothetical protein